jgi:hypothetical protein
LRHGAFRAFVAGKLAGLKMFSSVRKTAANQQIDAHRLSGILQDAEREISRVQRRTGFDWYWRVYFALTAGGAD